jgi:hypothetical protein
LALPLPTPRPPPAPARPAAPRQAIPFPKPFAVLRLALEVMFEGVEGAGHHPVKTAPGSKAGSGGGSGAASPARPEAGAGAGPGAAAKREEGEGVRGGEPQQQQQGQQHQGQQQQGQGADAFDEGVTVGDAVAVGYRAANPELGYDSHAVIQWRGGAVGDMLADAVVAVVLQAAGEPPAAAAAEAARAAALAAGDAEAAAAAELELAGALLRAQFGGCVAVDPAVGALRMDVDGAEVGVDVRGAKVACEDEVLRGRVERALGRVMAAMRPCVLDGEL